MITIEKVRVYVKYSGQLDYWARMASEADLKILNDEDWELIQGLIDDLVLMRKVAVADDYRKRVFQRMDESCDEEGKAALLAMVSTY